VGVTTLNSASLEPLTDLQHIRTRTYDSKTQFLTKFKKFQNRYDLPSRGKLSPALIGQQIELENCSNPPKTRDVF